jgi:hypothetical protein
MRAKKKQALDQHVEDGRLPASDDGLLDQAKALEEKRAAAIKEMKRTSWTDADRNALLWLSMKQALAMMLYGVPLGLDDFVRYGNCGWTPDEYDELIGRSRNGQLHVQRPKGCVVTILPDE